MTIVWLGYTLTAIGTLSSLVAAAAARHAYRSRKKYATFALYSGILTALGLLFDVAVASVVIIFLSATGWRPWHLILAVGCGAILVAIAYQWSAVTTRLAVALVVALGLIATLQVGRYETLADRLDGARSAAAQAAGDLEALDVDARSKIVDDLDLDVNAIRATGRTGTDVASITNGVMELGTAINSGPPIDDGGKRRAAIEVVLTALDTLPVPAQNPDPVGAYRAALATLQADITAVPQRVELADGATAAITDIEKACRVAGGQPADQQSSFTITTACGVVGRGASAVHDSDLGAQVVTAQQAVAYAHADLARIAFAASRPDAANRDSLRTALSVANLAAAETEKQPDGDQPIDMTDAIVRGGDALFSVGSGIPWSASLAIWLVLALALISGIRRLEIINGQLDVGPVEFDANLPSEAAPLRQALLLNVPQPGVQPGAVVKDAATTLSAVSASVGTYVKIGVTLLSILGIPPRGYKVSIVSPDAHAKEADRYVLLVLTSRRTGATIEAIRSKDGKPEELYPRIGYRAAATIIDRAGAVPPWKKWSAEIADACWDYDRLSRNGAQARSVQWMERLGDVVRSAPGDAQLLVQYGYELELADRASQAPDKYKTALAMWDDYDLARYRLAITRSNRLRELCGNAANAEENELYEVAEIAKNGVEEFRRLERDLTRRRLLLQRLSVRERQVATPWRGRSNRLLATQLGHDLLCYRFAQYARAQPKVLKCSKVDGVDIPFRYKSAYRREKRAHTSRSAVVKYNAACLLAQWKGAPEAAEMLDEARTCPDVGRISAAWLQQDPDLASVRKENYRGYYQRLVLSLPAPPTSIAAP